MSFTETLLMLLIGFKLTGCITWSWWWVLCPLWGEIVWGLLKYLALASRVLKDKEKNE